MRRPHTPILLVAGIGILLGTFLRSDFLSANQGKFEVSRKWEYPGGEVKPMQIYFESEGKLVFRGGFEYLNPSFWRYEETTQELVLIIPKLSDSQFEAIDWMLRRQSISKFDKGKKALHYQFDSKTESFDFLGWIYFKK